MRFVSRAAYLTAIAGLAAGTYGQTVHSETEANDNKAQANVIAGLVHLDRITGRSQGNVPGGGATSPDYFLVSPAPLPPGLYRHQLDLVGTTVGGIGSGLRGLDQTAAGVIMPGTDVQVHNGVVSATLLSNVWYGFGGAERVYFRVQGMSTSPVYTFEFTTTPATVFNVAMASGPFKAGPMSILVEGGFGNPDAEIWVYDSAFKPVLNFNNDDPVVLMTPADRASITRTFGPGTYYVAIGIANMANHLMSPADELTPADDDVLDFPGALTPAGGMNATRFGNITFMDSVGSIMLPQEPITSTARWYRIEVTSGCAPAQFVFGPSPMSVSAGQPVLLESLATGTDPIAYQWRKNGVDITGATQGSYSIAMATLNDAGSYTVVASNPCGSVESAAAVLDVLPLGPTITAQPMPQTLCIGSTASFSVSATGHLGAPLSYQWRKDGVLLPMGQSSVLEFSVAGLSDGGVYDCVVTEEGAGASTSDGALLTVRNDPPAITLNGLETMVVQCGSVYTELGATASDDCDGSVAVTIGGAAVNTGIVGLYVVEYNAMDSQGNPAATVNRYVHVVDTTPPVVKMTLRTKVMWPPDHRLQHVGLQAWAKDLRDATVTGASVKVRIFSDEPEVSGDGMGQHSPDAKNIAPGTLRLRRERRPLGNGRVYLIMGTAQDTSGNTGYAFGTVVCPQYLTWRSILIAWNQGVAIRKKAEALAKTAPNEQAVADGLKQFGYCEHGKGPKLGPFQ